VNVDISVERPRTSDLPIPALKLGGGLERLETCGLNEELRKLLVRIARPGAGCGYLLSCYPHIKTGTVFVRP
jgi:hypothetical protein